MEPELDFVSRLPNLPTAIEGLGINYSNGPFLHTLASPHFSSPNTTRLQAVINPARRPSPSSASAIQLPPTRYFFPLLRLSFNCVHLSFLTRYQATMPEDLALIVGSIWENFRSLKCA